MSTLRFDALKASMNRNPIKVDENSKRSSIFGTNVFGLTVMQSYLPKSTFTKLLTAIEKNQTISREIADQIAAAMKDWAISKGVTHYTHWFQPLTGATAEKHDAFFEISSSGLVIEQFDGNQLVQQEPDASSFPNGGIRNTFEARGYTAWDPTSPAFIFGTTLCIPTVFVAYTGEALDYKTPLLRALNAVDVAATAVARYFDKNVKKVTASLGWEQEYFLIDKSLAVSRPDLELTGRTLLGHSSAKGQQLDDHYFGTIPSRALNFMRDLENESILLGIPVKTRHNEVAPNQFELAPIYEETNLAVDHNSLIMDLMKKVADRHHFKVLFHENPFAGVNGSGKHNNWSLSTNSGTNLLAPGKTPMSNLQFLTFFINTIKAVNDNEELLRASIASASNDHRLGANEAPPAIMSVFIGAQLSKVLVELEGVTKGKLSPKEKTDLKLNVVGKIPEILLDNTDRNRTSPFAFTGNKFEFRAVGSTANCANPMTCSGGDQKARGKEGYIGKDGYHRLNILEVQRMIRFMPKVVIAVVPGWAVGGGHSLHVVCDLTLASKEHAIFKQTDADVTSFDGGYGSAYLAKMVGQKKAREIFFLGRNYTAEEAYEMGMVNAVISHEKLESTAFDWAQKILKKSPISIKMLKFSMNLTDDGMVGQQVFAGEATRLAYMTEEAKEGRDAFLEKRTPKFNKNWIP